MTRLAESGSRGSGRRQAARALFAILVLVAVFPGVRATMRYIAPEEGQAANESQELPEELLASVDGLGSRSDGLDTYSQALDAIQSRCVDSRQRIAEYALASRQNLKTHGIEDSVLSVLIGVVQGGSSEQGSYTSSHCADQFASYVRVRRAESE